MNTWRRSLPPLETLVAFQAAARMLSFTRAGEELHVTQAAVSRQIRLLEENLGVKLFTRSHRAVQLTPEGRAYQHTVSMALAHIANASQELRRDNATTTLSVATDQAIAALWLMPRLPGFQKANPAISVRVVVSDEDEDCLADGINIAIIHGDGSWSSHDARLLHEEEIFPVCSPGYLRERPALHTPQDLLDNVLLELEDEHWHWVNWRVWLTEHDVHHTADTPRLQINNYPLLIQAACAGQGIALGWRCLVDDHLASGELKRPLSLSLHTSYGYYVLTRKGHALSDVASTFLEWLSAQRASSGGRPVAAEKL